MDIQNKFYSQKTQQGTYKLIESNTAETYQRISILDNNKNVIGRPIEIYYGVTIDNISTLSKVIDISKNIIKVI